MVSQLSRIKLIHTLIWLFFNMVIFYMVYAVIANKTGLLLWIGIGMILAEGMVLLLFKMTCPLTLMARKYSNSQKDNFDIYLPNWLAKNNKLIYTMIFTLTLCGLVYRLLTNS